MNPEFKRNIWQELSVQRLIAMPAILLAIFCIVYFSHQNLNQIPHIALYIIAALLILWGSGLAADAIFQEIRDRTWDAQRMTPLQPWSMAWGKLLGSTIFVWYGAFCCLIAILITVILNRYQIADPLLAAKGLNLNQHLNQNLNLNLSLESLQNIPYQILFFLLIGLLSQAFALFLSLAFLRMKTLGLPRVTLIQIIAILAGLLFIFHFYYDFFWKYAETNLPNFNHFQLRWYHYTINSAQDFKVFSISSLVFFCLSLLFGIYRLFQTELQIKTVPWGLSLFLITFIFYVLGFSSGHLAFDSYLNTELNNEALMLTQNGHTQEQISEQIKGAAFSDVIRIGISYVILLTGTFLAAFFSSKNIIQYFHCFRSFREKRFLSALHLTPNWIFTALLSIFALIILLISIYKVYSLTLLASAAWVVTGFSVSLFLFLIRDIALVYYLTLNPQAKRGHLAAIVYLIVLYAIIPLLVSFTELPSNWYPVFSPFAWVFNFSAGPVTVTQVLSVLGLVFLQALIAWGFVISLWKSARRQLALA